MLLYSDGLTEARVGDGKRRYDDDGACVDSSRRWGRSALMR